MIYIKNVSKSFGPVKALQNIDLKISRGETTILIGPSGCGKSTLLRLIIGLTEPDSGSVEINGQKISKENLLSLRQKMGYVIQEGGLFPHLTAEKNLSLMSGFLGISRSRINEKIRELAELTRFPIDRLQSFPAELSGGQRQRISLMRALMLDPELLLCDEPLAALDPMIRSELQQDLRKIFLRLNKTVVWVTHDLNEAAFFQGRVILITQGTILQTGPLNSLITSPKTQFVTDFIKAQQSFIGSDFSDTGDGYVRKT